MAVNNEELSKELRRHPSPSVQERARVLAEVAAYVDEYPAGTNNEETDKGRLDRLLRELYEVRNMERQAFDIVVRRLAEVRTNEAYATGIDVQHRELKDYQAGRINTLGHPLDSSSSSVSLEEKVDALLRSANENELNNRQMKKWLILAQSFNAQVASSLLTSRRSEDSAYSDSLFIAEGLKSAMRLDPPSRNPERDI